MELLNAGPVINNAKLTVLMEDNTCDGALKFYFNQMQ